MKKLNNLIILDQTNKQEILNRCQSGVIFSPICPDYHFQEVQGKDKNERIHDFDGMGEEVGIVYEKLMKQSREFFELLDKKNISYQHILLVADVENYDNTILNKLKISKDEFNKRCQITVEKINSHLKENGFDKSKCLLMSEYFKEQKYPFYDQIKKLNEKLKQTTEKKVLTLIEKAQKIRGPFHNFWFGISEEQSQERTIEEMAMYASFGYCPKIEQGIILCADSEVLSACYNLFKNKPTPVFYLKGNY